MIPEGKTTCGKRLAFSLSSMAGGEQTDLKSDDVITDETVTGREERNAAS
jgi:hypothetical protein